MIITIDTDTVKPEQLKLIKQIIDMLIVEPITIIKQLSFIDTSKDEDKKKLSVTAVINGTHFGVYWKELGEKWYSVACITHQHKAENGTFATWEACEKWLNDKYAELSNSIVK